MPFHIVRNDLAAMTVDAIVNPTNTHGDAIGGLEAQLFKQAGYALHEARKELGIIAEGEVNYTEAFQLNAKLVFHTAGPKWHGGVKNELRLLQSCYKNSLNLAIKLKLSSVAFPLIATGSFGFPKDQALNIAVKTIKTFLNDHDLTIYLVVYDKKSYALSKERFDSVKSYIQSNKVYTLHKQRGLGIEKNLVATPLDTLFDDLDQTFSEAVLEQITKIGKADHEIYKKANIDRKLFSKIRSNKDYQPSKNTAMALGLALELDLRSFNSLIAKAGYALSPSSKTDLIIQYYIDRKIYDLFEINATLFEFTNKTL